MKSDRIASYLDRICKKTENYQLLWKPIDYYFKYYNDNAFLTSFLLDVKEKNEEMHPQPQSYYIRKDDMYLIISCFFSYSSNGLEKDIQLHGIFHKNGKLVNIPAYFNKYSAERLFELVEKYLEYKKGDYNLESSELFDFLEEFSS